MKSVEQIAKAAYEAYCVQAGGKTFDGKPLPTFAALGHERQACWVAAINAVRAEIEAVR